MLRRTFAKRTGLGFVLGLLGLGGTTAQPAAANTAASPTELSPFQVGGTATAGRLQLDYTQQIRRLPPADLMQAGPVSINLTLDQIQRKDGHLTQNRYSFMLCTDRDATQYRAALRAIQNDYVLTAEEIASLQAWSQNHQDLPA